MTDELELGHLVTIHLWAENETSHLFRQGWASALYERSVRGGATYQSARRDPWGRVWKSSGA